MGLPLANDGSATAGIVMHAPHNKLELIDFYESPDPVSEVFVRSVDLKGSYLWEW